MILRSSLSIRGLYYADNTIFEDFHLPDEIELDLIRTLILAECGELEILYPDPDYFKVILSAWSYSKLPEWNRIYEMLSTQYDPLSNYAKNIEHRGNGSSSSTDSVKGYNETNFVDSNKNASTDNNFYKRTVTGNIGIQSSSKLIQEEIDLRKQNDICQVIIDEFKQRFCILVY